MCVEFSTGLFVNQKIINVLLENLHIPAYCIHKLTLLDHCESVINGYNYLQMVIKDNLVDYRSSIFQEIKLLKKMGEVKILSGAHYLEKARELNKQRIKLKPELIKLNKNYDGLDLFFLRNCGLSNVVISEKGKELLESADATGVQFKPLPWLKR